VTYYLDMLLNVMLNVIKLSAAVHKLLTVR